MKILQMAFKALPQQQAKVQPQQRVTNPIFKAQKMNLQGPDRDMFVKTTKAQDSKKEFSNEDAMKLMREELKDSMPEKELDNFMGELNGMCEYLEIEPKNLPINEEHPGNLTDDQRKQIFTLLKFDALSPVTKKIA